ncbi:GFA family protein [Roseobacter litoralis]|uniref:Glutathione-dependent formaldehyde activating enzyme n=1 Tax=Roseobacter litoralis (strain ATCC 49566 / DSM 6996 / JCM 21268 / NBRC 15278 / OCh 149) TaxID=391595 RepID=F7ZB14_ROSLO|nr:GFA family protein [Roseobacter litoralis]AEI95556.1 putative glutathione-dependent formaldehyde activating enzyme [Roseobacter litoralis Och 149]
MARGSCLCGAVTFTTTVTPQEPVMCHCSQCRKQSGGIWSTAYVDFSDLSFSGDVSWYAASSAGKRGFCPICGSFLFWKPNDESTINIALGALDGDTGLKLEKHIYVANKGDYYSINDGLPQED